jgi:class 3 adenylate cyclase/pimeloyl-ACP methyl ester carboxylesterase
LVFVPSAISHIEVLWEDAAAAHYFRRLASFSRLILFDKRGVGMSDRMVGPATIEERMDDVRAVMEATGSTRAALCGMSEGGALAAVFAATYPERVAELILFNGLIKPWMASEARGTFKDYFDRYWGTGLGTIRLGAPSVADDPQIQAFVGRLERLALSPTEAAAVTEMNDRIDIRSVLSAISVPTLVMHRASDQSVDVSQGREAARLIPAATFVELPGADHFPYWEDPETSLGLIEEFVTGRRHHVEPDRVLATVLFTDIVDSTKVVASVGDSRWKALLDDYDVMVDRQLSYFGGRLVKTTGDGTLATFDGPGRAVHCACAIRDAVSALGLQVRVGVHTGEIETRGDDVGGIGVHVAQRVQAAAQPSEVLVSETVPRLVIGSQIEFTDRGEHELKGVPGRWSLFAVRT